MTHRAALVLSVALTLVLGAGVLIGRDRLFAAETGASPPATTSVAPSPGDGQGAALTETSPRIVEVVLPPSFGSGSEPAQARSEGDQRSFDRDEDDDDGGDRDWYDDDHDDEEHDDD